MAEPMDPEAALARGEQARRDRRLDEAAVAFAAAADRFRAVGPEARLAHALTRQAQIARDRGAFEQAVVFQTEALAIVRRRGDADALPSVIRHLADLLDDAGRHAEAAPLQAEMLALYRARPETPPLELANAVRSAAMHAQRIGDIAGARRLWTEARERYATLDALFAELTGQPGNPGVREADRRLVALG